MNHPCQYNLCVSLWNRIIRYQQTTPNLSIAVGDREHKSMACMMTAPVILLAGWLLLAQCMVESVLLVMIHPTTLIKL